MVTELRIYFEGDQNLRPGFSQFFKSIREAARNKRCRLELIATDGTPAEDFRDALAAHPDAWNVLLLDSDRSMDCSYEELCRRKGIDGHHKDRVFWMAQIMESWFLADIETLRRYYRQGFNEGALRSNPNVEAVPKDDVLSRLKRATTSTQPGEYHKTKHAPELLSRIDPRLVQNAAPNCERLFKLLAEKLAEQ